MTDNFAKNACRNFFFVGFIVYFFVRFRLKDSVNVFILFCEPMFKLVR